MQPWRFSVPGSGTHNNNSCWFMSDLGSYDVNVLFLPKPKKRQFIGALKETKPLHIQGIRGKIHQIKHQRTSQNAKKCCCFKVCSNKRFTAFWNSFWKCQANSEMSVPLKVPNCDSKTRLCTLFLKSWQILPLDQPDSANRTVLLVNFTASYVVHMCLFYFIDCSSLLL